MSSDLMALADRGWRIQSHRHGALWFVNGDREPLAPESPGFDVMHESLQVAERMAVAAAVASDGHDLIRLLNRAYILLAGSPEAEELRSRILRALMGTPPASTRAGAGQAAAARPEAGGTDPNAVPPLEAA